MVTTAVPPPHPPMGEQTWHPLAKLVIWVLFASVEPLDANVHSHQTPKSIVLKLWGTPPPGGGMGALWGGGEGAST